MVSLPGGWPEKVQFLLDQKADVNFQLKKVGRTPLMNTHGTLPMMQALLTSPHHDLTLRAEGLGTIYDAPWLNQQPRAELDNYRRKIRAKNQETARHAAQYIESCLLSISPDNVIVTPLITAYYQDLYPLALEHPLPEDIQQKAESKKNDQETE